MGRQNQGRMNSGCTHRIAIPDKGRADLIAGVIGRRGLSGTRRNPFPAAMLLEGRGIVRAGR